MFMDLDSIPSLPKRSAEQFKRKRKFNQTKRSITSRDVIDPNDEEIGQKIDSIQLRKKEEGAEKIINQSIDEMKSESQEIPADFKYQDVKYESQYQTSINQSVVNITAICCYRSDVSFKRPLVD